MASIPVTPETKKPIPFECLKCGFQNISFPEFPKEKAKVVQAKIKARAKLVEVCPRCGSMNIAGMEGVEYYMPVHAKCLDCGFEGLAFPAYPVAEAKKVSEKIRKKKRK